MFLYKTLFFQYLLFFQSQSCLLESTVAIFRHSAGYVLFVHICSDNYVIVPEHTISPVATSFKFKICFRSIIMKD